MEDKQLEIQITPRGVSIDAKGFVGRECERVVDAIEAELKRVGVIIDKKDRKEKVEINLPSSPQVQGQRV